MKTINEIVKEKIDDFRTQVIDVIKTIYEDKKEVDPVVFGLMIQDGKAGFVVLDKIADLFQSEIGKDTISDVVKQMAEKLKLLSIAIVSEGYISESESVKGPYINPEGKLKEALRPSEDPDSKEVLVINFETHDKQAMMIWTIGGNNLDLYKNMDWSDKTSMQQGRFDNLLNTDYSGIKEELRTLLKDNQN